MIGRCYDTRTVQELTSDLDTDALRLDETKEEVWDGDFFGSHFSFQHIPGCPERQRVVMSPLPTDCRDRCCKSCTYVYKVSSIILDCLCCRSSITAFFPPPTHSPNSLLQPRFQRRKNSTFASLRFFFFLPLSFLRFLTSTGMAFSCMWEKKRKVLKSLMREKDVTSLKTRP